MINIHHRDRQEKTKVQPAYLTSYRIRPPGKSFLLEVLYSVSIKSGYFSKQTLI